MFRYSNCIHQEEAVFAKSIRSDIAQLFVTDSTNTTSFHLNVERFGSHIAHKEKHFKRFYVCTCGNQRASHRNAKFSIHPKLAYQLVAVSRWIGYLLYKSVIVFMSEHLFRNTHDVCRMIFVKSEYQRFGQIVHVWLSLGLIKHFWIDRITICFKYQLDLSRIDDASV